MPLTFVIGRAGSGKSRYCLDEIRTRLREDPAGPPLILLVPEQATFQAEYELVTTPGLHGTLRAQALSFRRLAYRVMQECGGTARIHIDDTGKQMLLYKILQARRDDLEIFHKAAEQRGFIAELNELFNEFRRYQNDAGSMEEILARAARHLQEDEDGEAASFVRKIQDLRIIYQEFETHLAGHYVDSEDYLQTLAQHASRSAYLREAELWIDGFAGFTPQEYAVIGELMRTVKQVTVALCLDRDYELGEMLHELNMFYTPASTMLRLKELAERYGVALSEPVLLTGEAPRYKQAPMLAHLEKHFALRHPPAYLGGIELLPDTKRRMAEDSQVRIAAAVNPRAEIEAAAREILKLVQTKGVRFREIAVVTRTLETYGDLMATVFEDHGIPYFMDHKKSVMHHPVVELIRSALEVIVHNWRYESVFRCVKTDLISDDRQAMDELENYVLAFGIEGSRWTEDKRWEFAVQRSLDEDEPAERLSEEELTRIHEARMQVAEPLMAFEREFKAAKDVRGQVTAVYELLAALRVPEKLLAWSEEALAAGHPERAKEHSALWNRLIAFFDQIVEILGSEKLSAEQFSGVLDAGLESMKLGLVPPSLDQVLIGTLDRTRFGQVRYAFIIGVNDGVLPAKMAEGGILSEAEREMAAGLGMQLAPDSRRRLLDELFLAYTGFTLPSEGLWISYPLADEEGRALLPSEYVRRISRMFPHLASAPDLFMAEPSALLDEAMQADYLVHPERSMSYLLHQLRLWLRGGELAPIWREALAWYAKDGAWRSKLEQMMYAFYYTNQERPLSPETSSLLYGHKLTASVSRMERFAACPFMQFASHGLRLKERRIYRLEAPDIGQLFHAALNKMARDLIDDGVRWRDLTAEELMRRAEQAVDTVAPRLQSEILFSTERFQYMTRRLKGTVSRTAAMMGKHAKRGEFEPVALELGFGPGEQLKPLTFTLDNGVLMELVGRIDRVDAAPYGDHEWLRIIDYKSGAKSLSLAEVYYGLSLQLLAYLDVVISQAAEWRGKPGLPAGALYFQVHNPLIQTARPMHDEEYEQELLKQYKMQGIVAADHEAIQAMDNELESGRSPIIPVGLKKDGGFYSDSNVADEEQWQAVRRLVRRKIRQIGEDIVRGRVEIMPYRKGKRSPCSYCVYRPVCQFDTLLEENGYRFLHDWDRDELWQMIMEQKEEA